MSATLTANLAPATLSGHGYSYPATLTAQLAPVTLMGAAMPRTNGFLVANLSATMMSGHAFYGGSLIANLGPVTMTASATSYSAPKLQMPNAQAPFLDPATGVLSLQWLRFFLTIKNILSP